MDRIIHEINIDGTRFITAGEASKFLREHGDGVSYRIPDGWASCVLFDTDMLQEPIRVEFVREALRLLRKVVDGPQYCQDCGEYVELTESSCPRCCFRCGYPLPEGVVQPRTCAPFHEDIAEATKGCPRCNGSVQGLHEREKEPGFDLFAEKLQETVQENGGAVVKFGNLPF